MTRNHSTVKALVKWLPFVPWTFLRHYVYPALVRGKRVEYDPKEYFELHYSGAQAVAGEEGKLTNEMTIGVRYDPDHARLHYSAVERSIRRALADTRPERFDCVLDIGSGSGHWIDFYRTTYGAKRSVGLDISEISVRALEDKYATQPDVRVQRGDISESGFTLEERFDVINAIGVMFHIVSDDALQVALKNCSEMLNKDGVLVIGGQFGMLTRNVFFEQRDGKAFVNKRIRSRRWWRDGAARAGLRVVGRFRTRREPGIIFPENNVLLLTRA